MTGLQKHRCAVCWKEQPAHDDWFKHATEKHSAVLAEFGMDICRGVQGGHCPGVQHARRLPNYGENKPRIRPLNTAPIKARDGTTYTPVPLFPDGPAA